MEPGRAPRRGTLIYVAHPLLSDSAAALLFTHNCEILVGSGTNYIGVQKIKKPTVIHKKFASNKNSIPIKSKNVPFDMKAESITPFPHLSNGYNYSYTGVRISMKRNTLGLLLGRFYGPTAVFSALSLLSYNINMDMVL